jgi:hypothetical protein
MKYSRQYKTWIKKSLIPFIKTVECLSKDGIGCFILPTEDNTKNNTVTDTQKLLKEKGLTSPISEEMKQKILPKSVNR